VCNLQEKLLTIKDTMTIEGANGESLATVKKALISPLRDRWTVKVGDRPDLSVKGNILDFEYTIGIEPSQNDLLILAVTVALDRMAHS